MVCFCCRWKCAVLLLQVEMRCASDAVGQR
eukprot:COSAG01_NODE_11646_length_1888_cov_19.550028_3_plen_29_part_01